MPKISIKCSGNFDILKYPFGMELEGRTYSSSGYRHGFNGQVKDDEIYGEGNTYSAQYWEYDNRLGRRWNVDPLPKAHESMYVAFANNPIWFVDPDGRDTILFNKKGKFAKNTLPDNKNNFDVLIKVNNWERITNKINYSKEGRLRGRHSNMIITKNGMYYNSKIKSNNEDLPYNGTKIGFYLDKVSAEESANIYKFLVNTTYYKYEFSYIVESTSFGVNRFITTSHQKYSDNLGSYYSSLLVADDKLISHIHSHPYRPHVYDPDPTKPSYLDENFRDEINKKQTYRTLFGIYHNFEIHDYTN